MRKGLQMCFIDYLLDIIFNLTKKKDFYYKLELLHSEIIIKSKYRIVPKQSDRGMGKRTNRQTDGHQTDCISVSTLRIFNHGIKYEMRNGEKRFRNSEIQQRVKMSN